VLPVGPAFVSSALLGAFVVDQLNPVRGIGGAFVCSGAAWLRDMINGSGEPCPEDPTGVTYAGAGRNTQVLGELTDLVAHFGQ